MLCMNLGYLTLRPVCLTRCILSRPLCFHLCKEGSKSKYWDTCFDAELIESIGDWLGFGVLGFWFSWVLGWLILVLMLSAKKMLS